MSDDLKIAIWLTAMHQEMLKTRRRLAFLEALGRLFCWIFTPEQIAKAETGMRRHGIKSPFDLAG